MKKAAVLASVASMIDQFNRSNIQLLQSMGYHVDVIADFSHPGNLSAERARDLIRDLESAGCSVYDISIPRSINPGQIIHAYRKVKALVAKERYDLLHCQSPVGGVIARVAVKKQKGTRVIYTAHGFHFYSGAPIMNWIVFYPVERWLSGHTDVLITINREDYLRAKKSFHAGQTVYIPGIGVDMARFSPESEDGEKIRHELGISETGHILLSVGELNRNKNHASVIQALSGMNIPYVIVGKGELSSELMELARNEHVNLHLMGYRTDVADFYRAADIYILPSIREGLNVSLMEAMASGKPCLAGRIRGNTDLIDEDGGGFLFDPSKPEEIHEAIERMLAADWKKMGTYNRKKMEFFSREHVMDMMKTVYLGGNMFFDPGKKDT